MSADSAAVAVAAGPLVEFADVVGVVAPVDVSLPQAANAKRSILVKMSANSELFPRVNDILMMSISPSVCFLYR